jgi:hypothetical protein
MDFPDICTISPFVSEDGYQVPTYGTGFMTICKYEELQEKDSTGSFIVSSGWLALPPETAIHLKDKITLEDGETPSIMKLRKIKSPVSNEVEYIRIILGEPMTGRDI